MFMTQNPPCKVVDSVAVPNAKYGNPHEMGVDYANGDVFLANVDGPGLPTSLLHLVPNAQSME